MGQGLMEFLDIHDFLCITPISMAKLERRLTNSHQTTSIIVHYIAECIFSDRRVFNCSKLRIKKILNLKKKKNFVSRH